MNNATRIMNSQVREEALKDLSSIFVKWMMEMGMFSTCLNCAHWKDNPTELCTKFKQRPPAKVIVVGCEHHTDIPF